MRLGTEKVILLLAVWAWVFGVGVVGWTKPPKFKDVSKRKGFPVNDSAKYMGCCIGDFDKDGWPDLFLLNHGDDPKMLWSKGGGRYKVDEVPRKLTNRDLHSCAAADLDRDGLDDFIVTQGGMNGQRPSFLNIVLQKPNHVLELPADSKFGIEKFRMRGRSIAFADFRGVGLLDLLLVNARVNQKPRAHLLFKNLGNGKFRYIRRRALETVNARWFHILDFNNDHIPDIFFMGFRHLELWQGKGDLRFSNRTLLLPDMGQYDFVNSVTEIDYDQDGRMEIFLARGSNLPEYVRPNNMIRWTGESFIDVSAEVGLTEMQQGRYRHATNGDYNNDGFEDLWVTTERVFDTLSEDIMLINQKDGTFKPKLIKGTFPPPLANDYPLKPFEEPIQDHDHAQAIDLDQDGRIDVLSSYKKGRWVFYRNSTARAQSRRYLLVKVLPSKGRKYRDPLGAKVKVVLCNGKEVAKRVGPQGGSHHQPSHNVLHFGVGPCRKVEKVIVYYSGRVIRRAANVKTNKMIKIE